MACCGGSSCVDPSHGSGLETSQHLVTGRVAWNSRAFVLSATNQKFLVQIRRRSCSCNINNFNLNSVQLALVLEDYEPPALRVQGFVSRKKGARSIVEEKKEGGKSNNNNNK